MPIEGKLICISMEDVRLLDAMCFDLTHDRSITDHQINGLIELNNRMWKKFFPELKESVLPNDDSQTRLWPDRIADDL